MENLMQASETTSATHQVIYFNEGDGYFFIRSFHGGHQSNVSLVRSRVDGALYVRKEEKEGEANTIDQDTQSYVNEYLRYRETNSAKSPVEKHLISDGPFEVMLANKFRDRPGVYKPIGWTFHRSDTEGVYVSYWKYYEIGSVKSYCRTLNDSDDYEDPFPLPEFWVCRLLALIARTVMDMHRAGVYHNDLNNTGNLLLTCTRAPQSPETRHSMKLVMADFGTADTYTTAERGWDDKLFGDWRDLVWIAAALLCPDDPYYFYNLDRKNDPNGPGVIVPVIPVPGSDHLAAPATEKPCSEKLERLILDLCNLGEGQHPATFDEYDKTVHEWYDKVIAHYKTLDYVPWRFACSGSPVVKPYMELAEFRASSRTRQGNPAEGLPRIWSLAEVTTQGQDSTVQVIHEYKSHEDISVDDGKLSGAGKRHQPSFRPTTRIDGGFPDHLGTSDALYRLIPMTSSPDESTSLAENLASPASKAPSGIKRERSPSSADADEPPTKRTKRSSLSGSG